MLVVDAGEDARGEHGGGVARAFLVGPVGDDDGVFCLDAEVVEGADDFQPAQNAKDAVILAARGLRVEVGADVNGERVGVVAVAPGEHVAHGVEAHAQARRLAPRLKQRAALGILVGQGLTVVAARDARADLGHFHQAVPEPVAVDLKILARCGHRCPPVCRIIARVDAILAAIPVATFLPNGKSTIAKRGGSVKHCTCNWPIRAG